MNTTEQETLRRALAILRGNVNSINAATKRCLEEPRSLSDQFMDLVQIRQSTEMALHGLDTIDQQLESEKL